tara:strand:+ start:1808 stop:2758 length:951 start_codon:yes stop_codon:yes gene_type:complete
MYFLINFFTILIGLHIYKNIWPYFKVNKIPTGAGIILLLCIVSAFYLNNELYSIKFGVSLLILSILTLIYYIDDLRSLSVFIRILLQIIMGIAISISFFFDLFSTNIYILLFILILVSFLSLLLTNTINFYDGADLNISVFAILNFLILFYVFSSDKDIQILINLSLIFFIAFSLLNYKKDNLYFGDAGSFFLAGIFLIFILYAILEQNLKILYLLTTLSFPILDVIYVILYRIYLKESLHTRHFHQIYQVVQRKQIKWLYLLIQPINTGLSIILILFLSSLGINETFSIIISCSFISFNFYFLLRYFLFNSHKTE